MRLLLSDRYAPITSAIGFLELPLEEAGKGLLAWRKELFGWRTKASAVSGSLPEMLERLPPLTGGVRPRELLVGTFGDRWTAYFDCAFQGSDPSSTVGHLSQALQCQGVTVSSVPHTVGTSLATPGRYGGVQFELYGPLQTDFINYVRTISAAHDGERWRFDADGTVQAFEQTDRPCPQDPRPLHLRDARGVRRRARPAAFRRGLLLGPGRADRNPAEGSEGGQGHVPR
jgi:hypothetical protein